MNNARPYRRRILYICQAGMIAALYTVLTCLVGAFDLASSAIQFRVSEALCVLPVFMPAAIPGLTIGCLLSNLILGSVWSDIVFGTLATLIGALGSWLLRKASPWLVPLPTVVANTLVVPWILKFGYRLEGGIPFFMLTVGIGEFLSAYVVGMILLLTLRRYGKRLFGNS